MFAGLGVFFSFAVLFSLERKYSIAEMLILWLGTLLFVRYVGREVFARFSYHRGIWHSILAMIFCAFVTAWVYRYLLGRDEQVSWLAAGFLAVGFLTHLVLDEIYSVDVMDTRIKASFGTALKLFDHRHLGHSSAMAIAAVLVFLATPPTRGFMDSITSRSLWSGLHQRLLPQNQWFGGMAWMSDRAPNSKADGVVPAGASPIATGSITRHGAHSRGQETRLAHAQEQGSSQHHDRGGHARRDPRFTQDEGRKKRPEQHAGLAQGSDQRDGGDRHRPYGNCVGCHRQYRPRDARQANARQLQWPAFARSAGSRSRP